MSRILIVLMLTAVFPHFYEGTQSATSLDKELCEWKGLPVTLSVDSSYASGFNDGSFSIRKNMAPTVRDEEGLTIVAADSLGLLNGVYFLLRAQQQRDTCLCITLPHYDTVRIMPLFPRRVAVYDYSYIRDVEKADSLTEMIRRDAMSGINGWIVENKDFSSNDSLERRELEFNLEHFGITLFEDRGSLGDSSFELTDAGNRKFMGDNWSKLMRDACRNGYTTAIYRPECPSAEHPFREINLYLFGRLSSDSNVMPRRIAYEWLAKTYSDNPLIVRPLLESLLNGDEISFLHEIKRI